MVEKTNGAVTSNITYLWAGSAIAEERDSTGGNMTKRYLGGGMMVGATKYFFTADHLGSVREVTDNAGTIVSRFDYDPYGNRTQVGGTFDPGMGFTGHFHHSSGLVLTWFRGYDPVSARWLNRDPIGESGGLNLYAYVGNDPINRDDPLGLMDNSVNATCRQNPLVCLQMGIMTSAQLAGLGVPLAALAASPAGQRAAQCAARVAPWFSSLPAQASNAATQLHHAIPQFLGGLRVGQTLVAFPTRFHSAFHSMLNQALRVNGLLPGNASSSDWANFMRSNPGAQQRALDVLLNTSRAFDARYGTTLTQSVWREVMSGGFRAYP